MLAHATRRNRLEPAIRVLPALAAFLLFLQQGWRFCRDPRFFVDDPFISMRFAANLVRYGELSFNPGVRVEGYSNLLHVFMHATLFRLRGSIPDATSGIAAVAAIVFVASLLALLGLFLLSRLTPRDSAESLAWHFAWILTMASSAFAFWSTAGLETPIECFLYVCIALVAVEERWTRPGQLCGLALLLFGVTLNRFEGVLVAGSICVALLVGLDPQRRRRAIGALALLVAVPAGTYHLFRWWYFGSVLPNTYIAKATGGSLLGRLNAGAHYCGNWLATLGGGIMVIALLLALAALLRNRTRNLPITASPAMSSSVRVALAILVAKLGLVTVGGGDWMPGFRMLVPVAPFGFFLAIRLLLSAHAGVPNPRLSGITSLLLTAAIPFVVRGVPTVPVGVETNHTHGLRRIPASYVNMGILLARSFSGNEEVAIGEAGLIPFEAYNVRFLDMFGLVDSDMARQPGSMHHRVHAKHLNERSPVAVLFAHLTVQPPHGPYQYGPELLATPDFHARYRRTVLDPALEMYGWALYLRRDVDAGNKGLAWMDVDPIANQVGK